MSERRKVRAAAWCRGALRHRARSARSAARASLRSRRARSQEEDEQDFLGLVILLAIHLLFFLGVVDLRASERET